VVHKKSYATFKLNNTLLRKWIILHVHVVTLSVVFSDPPQFKNIFVLCIVIPDIFFKRYKYVSLE